MTHYLIRADIADLADACLVQRGDGVSFARKISEQCAVEVLIATVAAQARACSLHSSPMPRGEKISYGLGLSPGFSCIGPGQQALHFALRNLRLVGLRAM